ncbi:NADH-quinone oxidoreductase subunit C [Acidicapsa ligni]|uniref:NADH-quinone oxidoreductase subunit C n=1 Tax=Acidicapsa ligni TaxID=542300 RepID=UPI0021E02192|nr:NADH-quinone oxidoreductase subunit C [Acidicapsa ligni]
MSTTLPDKESVLREKADHPAVVAIINWKPEALAEACWDRNELTLTIAREEIVGAGFAVQKAGYNFLEDVTAVDWLPASPRFQVSYHIVSHSHKERIRLRVMVDDKRPSLDTITSVWPSANYYEREVFDLFGIRFDGHPNLRRIMMPEEWEGHPLRKDYPVEGYR